MTTKQIDIYKSATPLADLLAIVKSGDEAILVEGDIPLARITPLKANKKARVAGLNQGAFEIIGDFDAPLPDEFWLGEEQKI